MARRARSSPFADALQKLVTRAGQDVVRAGSKAVRHAIKVAVDQQRPPSGRGDWIAGQTIGPAGLRRYHLFRPQGVGASERLPLLVMLHGCAQNGRTFAESTRMNSLAASKRFLVLYPEQELLANPQGCWNWYDTQSGQAQREVATLIGMVEQVCRLYPIDEGAVALAGISAGASMAALLASEHPERFAAVAMHSGVPPGSARSAASAMAAMRGRRTPGEPVSLGPWPPLLVIHGRSDRVVAPENGRAAAALWAEVAQAGPLPARSAQRGKRYPATTTEFRNGRQRIATLIEIDRLGHAWSGGKAGEPFSDPAGPDASRLIWAFVLRHLPVSSSR